MIIARHSLADLKSKDVPLRHHLAGLQYTRSGYGGKIPTARMVQLPGSPRWRRVYCACYGNGATCYVLSGKDWIVIDE